MFKNLKAEMAREGLSGNGVAEKIGITGRAFSNKMTGNSEFTLKEANGIRKIFLTEFGKEFTLEYLFETSDYYQKLA